MRGRSFLSIVVDVVLKRGSVFSDMSAPFEPSAPRARTLRPYSVFHEDSQHTEVSEELFNRLITNQRQEELLDQLYKIYLDVQDSTVNFEFNTLRRLTTDELFNNLRTQLEVLQYKGGINIKSDFSCIDLFISDIREMKDLLAVDVTLAISYYDYIIDSETGNFIRGNKHTKIGCYYKLTFVGSPYATKENACPNCGSDLGDRNSSECGFCKSVVVNKLHTWVLAKSKITSLLPKNLQRLLQSITVNAVDDDRFNSFVSGYSKKDFAKMLFNTFVDFQESWDEADLEKLKSLASNSLFDIYEKQNNFLNVSGKKKVKRRLRLMSAEITNIDEKSVVIEALFGACSCTIQVRDNSVETQNRSLYNYRLAFIKDGDIWKLDQINLLNRIKK